MPLIFLAAAGMASMLVRVDAGFTCRRVGSWQWSGLSCETSTTLGSGISERLEIHEGTVCFDRRNFGCHMDEGPESHGSTRTEKVPGGWPYRFRDGRCSAGEKVKRKVVSPFSCLILRDMPQHRAKYLAFVWSESG